MEGEIASALNWPGGWPDFLLKHLWTDGTLT